MRHIQVADDPFEDDVHTVLGKPFPAPKEVGVQRANGFRLGARVLRLHQESLERAFQIMSHVAGG
jgi:hypothetical protein